MAHLIGAVEERGLNPNPNTGNKDRFYFMCDPSFRMCVRVSIVGARDSSSDIDLFLPLSYLNGPYRDRCRRVASPSICFNPPSVLVASMPPSNGDENQNNAPRCSNDRGHDEFGAGIKLTTMEMQFKRVNSALSQCGWQRRRRRHGDIGIELQGTRHACDRYRSYRICVHYRQFRVSISLFPVSYVV